MFNSLPSVSSKSKILEYAPSNVSFQVQIQFWLSDRDECPLFDFLKMPIAQTLGVQNQWCNMPSFAYKGSGLPKPSKYNDFVFNSQNRRNFFIISVVSIVVSMVLFIVSNSQNLLKPRKLFHMVTKNCSASASFFYVVKPVLRYSYD